MKSIVKAQIGSTFDFDHGEGWVTFSWLDNDGISRSLSIDAEGHCSREMPVRSGTGVTIISVHRDRVCLRFTERLAASLELDHEIEFQAPLSEETSAELLRLADLL
jgi:hypothetical protein